MTLNATNRFTLFCFKSSVMTQKKYLLILILWMAFLPVLLKAQKIKPISLKTGDWFQVKLKTKMRSSIICSDKEYDIKYNLTKRESAGNTIYEVTVERGIIKDSLIRNPLLGYDSYYPSYVQNKPITRVKAYFIVKTDKNDKVVNIKTVGKVPMAVLTEIIPRKDGNISGTQNAYGSDIVNSVTTALLTSIKSGKRLITNDNIRPQRKDIIQGMSIYLTAASFKFPIDTLIKSNIRELGINIHKYTLDSVILQYNKIKTQVTNREQDGFITDYALSLAFLKDYPLYYQLSRLLASEISKSDWKSIPKIKPYYDDFINNCGDSLLVNPLKKRWNRLEAWAPGSPNPLKELILKDGSKFDLQKFKGKILCVLLNYKDRSYAGSYLDVIKKQNPKEVQFVIGQFTDSLKDFKDYADNFANLPNVTYINMGEGKVQQGVDIGLNQIKAFVLDKKQNVVNDNMYQIGGAEFVLNAYIQKAYKAGDMTDTQKTALLNTITWSAVSILFTALVVFTIYKVRINTIKKNESVKRQLKELEIKAIRSQMNPHFIFNSLNSIQSLNNNSQYKEANRYLEKFAILMRNVLNNSEKPLVSLADELKALKLYCELEQLRFDFDFSIEISENVNEELIEIPGMIIQPLVENAIIHGLAQKGTQGLLALKITIAGIYLQIVVTDNGPGFKPDQSRPGGFGLKLVRERLNILNDTGSNGTLTINSNFEDGETGTTVILTIPID